MLALVLAPLVALAPPAQACGPPRTVPTAQNTQQHAQKLGDLPDAEMDLAVIRTMNGCYVRQVVRFHVSDRNPLGSATPGEHVPGYTGTLVPEGAVTRVTPTGR